MASKNTAPTLPEKVISLIEASSAMAEKAASAEQARHDFEKEAGAMIPGLVDTLAAITIPGEQGPPVPLLEQDEKVACAEALKDPQRAFHILVKVANHFKNAQADRLGQGEPNRREKKASTESPYAGRRTSQEPESWQRFRKGIMGG